MQWKAEDEVTIKSFANNIHTLEGGTHEEGLRTAITKAINDLQNLGIFTQISQLTVMI